MLKITICAVFLIATIVVAQEERPHLPPPEFDPEKKCEIAHGATSKVMDELMVKIKRDGLDGVEVDERTMCYFQCILDNFGHTDSKGRADFIAIVKEKVPHALPTVEECVAKYDSEERKCARAFKISACIGIAMEEQRRQRVNAHLHQ